MPKPTIAGLKKLVADLKERAKAAKSGAEAPSWLKYVAMLTGILAALAAFLTVRSTNLTNDAIYASNQAVLAQAQASDAWAEYQADSIKARIIETQMTTPGVSADDRTALGKDDDDMRAKQPKAKQLATDKETERDSHLVQGHKHLAQKDLLGYASLSVQLGIALASVAAMVHVRLAFMAGVMAGVIGAGITAYAFAGPLLGQ